MPQFLKNKYVVILTLILVAQAVAMNVGVRPERVPEIAPLSLFPVQIDDWVATQEFPMEKEVADVLRADDTLNRLYTRGAEGATLFVAFFKTQRTGQAPHSPKNCLPGSGWEPSETGEVTVPVQGSAEPIRINRYIVSRGSEKSLVLYWYQSRRRAVASEFAAKFWLVADSIRHQRSDTSLVRVVVRVENGDEAAADRTGAALVQAVYPKLLAHLPN